MTNNFVVFDCLYGVLHMFVEKEKAEQFIKRTELVAGRYLFLTMKEWEIVRESIKSWLDYP